MSGSGASAVCEVEGGVSGGREGGESEGLGGMIDVPAHSDVKDIVHEIIASALTTGTPTSSTSISKHARFYLQLF